MPFVAPILLAGLIIKVGLVVAVGGLIGLGVSKSIQGYAKKKKEARRAADRLKTVQLMEIVSETPRRVIYGRARVSGPIIFAHVTNDNRLLHLVLPIAWHAVDGFEQWLFDGRLVELDADGWVDTPDHSMFTMQTEALFINQDFNEAAYVAAGSYTVTINATAFTITLATDSTPLVAMQAMYDEITGDGGYSAENYTVSGPFIIWNGRHYAPRIVIKSKAVNAGLPLHTAQFSVERHDSPFRREVTTDVETWENFVYRGLPDAGQKFENWVVTLNQSGNLQQYPVLANAQIITKSTGTGNPPAELVVRSGRWSNSHRLEGNSYVYIMLIWIEHGFMQLPNVETILRGKALHDPRDPSYPNDTALWSGSFGDPDIDAGRNPALVLLDYLRNSDYGLGIPDADIDTSSFVTAANICDEPVFSYYRNNDTSDPITEERYTFDGVIEVTGTHRDRVEQILVSMAGKLHCHGGTYSVRAGAYTAPSITLTIDDLRSGLQLRTRASGRDLINCVKGVYMEGRSGDREKGFQIVDFSPLRLTDWVTEDNDREIWGEFEFPNTTSASMARRLAKIEAERTRRQITCTFPAKLTALNIRAGDTVAVTISRYGWTAKTFEVVESSIQTGTDDGDMGVDLLLHETDANIYAWANEYGVDWQMANAAPATDLPNWATVGIPGTPMVTEMLNPTYAGTEAVGIVSWEPSADAFVDAYELQWRQEGAIDWNPPVTVLGTRYTATGLVSGNAYDFRVRARNAAGAFSTWTEQRGYSFLGLLAVPSDVTDFTVEPHEGFVILQWALTPDLDVKIGGHFELRYQNVTTGADWDSAEIVTDAIPGTSTTSIASLRSGTWLIRAVDSTGQVSGVTTVVLDTIPTFNGFQLVTTEAEHTDAWSGTKTDTYVSGSDLVLGGGDLMDDWGALDSVLEFDIVGGTAGSGTYLTKWSALDYYDLGYTFDFRLNYDLAWSRTDLSTLFDSHTDLIDDWPDLDASTVQGTGNVIVEARTTDDDPSGAPTWTAWQTITGPTDLRARAVQVRLKLTSDFETHTVTVTEFTVRLYLPERTETAAGAAILAAGSTITFANAFQAAPSVECIVIAPSVGDYVDLSAVTASNFTVTVRNSGGTGIAKSINWIAYGWGGF